MDLARPPRRRPLTARKKGSGYENDLETCNSLTALRKRTQTLKGVREASIKKNRTPTFFYKLRILKYPRFENPDIHLKMQVEIWNAFT